VTVLGTDTLRPDDVARLARRAGCSIVLAAEATERMERSVALRDELVADGRPIYGVTTGFGDSNVGHISAAKAAALQHSLVQYHLVGSGPPAPADVVRATMAVRANCLARGYSGVRTEVVQLLIDCLAHDILPLIPERGSVGASGDLVPLCYLANMLAGSGDVEHAGSRRPAEEALRAAGLHPIEFQAKEALALINGTSFMSGFAVMAAHDAAEVAFAAEVCTALSVEVLLGNRGHHGPVLHAQKPHPGQVHSAATISALLTGSALARDDDEVVGASPVLGERGYQRLDQPIQDRYSVRCAPHVVGVLHDTLEWAGRWIAVEINSTNDNPLFDPDTRAVYSGGNFYGGHIGLAMDSLKVAVGSVGDLLDRQLALVVDERFNHGLTANLVPHRAHDQLEAGLHHGFKGAQIACSALAAEALKLGAPATAYSRSTEAHNQDKVSMGTIAARDARTVVELVRRIAAIHLAALCQAADLRGADRLAEGTRRAYDCVREHVGFLDGDRRMDAELDALADALGSGALREAVGPALRQEVVACA
jgi:histidine ammonia-lyase/phenylalanine ammonia-lyase